MTTLGNSRLEALESGTSKLQLVSIVFTLPVSLQLRGLIWRIIPRPSFVTRFYVANPVPTQLICTIAVLGMFQFLRSRALSPLLPPHILRLLDPVPLIVVLTGIASANPNPQRG